MRRHSPVLVAMTLLATAVAAVGCAASPSPASQSTSAAPTRGSAAPAAAAVAHTSWDVSNLPSPCRTISNTEAAAVVGGNVNPGMVLESWPPLCQFVLNAQARTYLYISDDSGVTTGKEDYDRKRSTSSQTEAVSGIGDQAYWQPDLASLHVLGGRTHVFVAFAGTPVPADAKDKALAIARIILPRAQA